jgi:hypothetical protein
MNTDGFRPPPSATTGAPHLSEPAMGWPTAPMGWLLQELRRDGAVLPGWWAAGWHSASPVESWLTLTLRWFGLDAEPTTVFFNPPAGSRRKNRRPDGKWLFKPNVWLAPAGEQTNLPDRKVYIEGHLSTGYAS